MESSENHNYDGSCISFTQLQYTTGEKMIMDQPLNNGDNEPMHANGWKVYSATYLNIV